MDYSKYGSNSDQAKLEQNANRDGAGLRPIPQDDYIPKRTNWFREFIKGDVETARTNVARDVVIPFIKRMIVDSVNVFLTTILDNVASTPKKRTDYNSISRGGTLPIRTAVVVEPEDRETTAFHECSCKTNGPVELALDTLQNIIERTGSVKVIDYYDRFGQASKNPSFDNHFGWTDLSMAQVAYNVWDGVYYIKNLPRPKFLG